MVKLDGHTINGSQIMATETKDISEQDEKPVRRKGLNEIIRDLEQMLRDDDERRANDTPN